MKMIGEPITTPILAIELGKYKSVACFYQPCSAQVAFHTFTTSRSELLALLDQHRGVVVVIEACVLTGWIHDLCGSVGVLCLVANTSSEAWKFKHAKRKTDKDDALCMA